MSSIERSESLSPSWKANPWFVLWRALVGLALALVGFGSPLCAGAATTASGWQARSWTADDGLPVSSINALLQGRQGYLWLATFDGLVRFDGVRFEVFRSADYEALPSDRFTTLLQDEEGDLWVTTEQLDLVRFRDGVFTHFHEGNGLPDRGVISWYRAADGSLWFGTRSGLAMYRDGQMSPFALGIEELRVGILAILVDADDTVWVGTENNGVLRYRDETVRRFSLEDGLPSLRVDAVIRDAEGRLIVGTEEGVALETGGAFELMTTVGSARRRVLDLAPLSDGTVLVASREALERLRGDRLVELDSDTVFTGAETLAVEGPDGGLLINTTQQLLVDGITVFSSEAAIKSVTRDHEGNLWLGTAGNGLFRLRETPLRTVGRSEGLVQENLYPIVEGPAGTFWTGGFTGGVQRVREGRAESLGSLPGWEPTPIRSILPDGAGGLWIGADGVVRFDGATFHRRGVPALLRADEQIHAIFADRRGALWFGTASVGLFRFQNGVWTHWTAEDGLPDRSLRFFADDPAGNLWIGTNGAGVVRFDGSRFERLGTEQGLPSDLIRSILIEPSRGGNSVAWVGTENRGLVRVAVGDDGLEGAEITTVTRADGLSEDGVHQILDDGRGRLWMSSNRGIFRVERSELDAFAAGDIERIRSVSYTEADGMANREANGGVQSAGLRASDGTLWFPTQGGIVIVDPERVAENSAPPKVVIEEVVGRGSSAESRFERPHAERLDEPLRLEMGVRDLDIRYTGLSFVEPERVRFRYRLHGRDDGWTEAGTRRQAIFTNLSPGTYRFEVEAANEHLVWSSAPAALGLVIPARFYETAWFQAFVALGLLTIGFGIGVWRLRLARRHQHELEVTVHERTAELAAALEHVEEQADELRQLDEAKSRFFANISHELRTPLTLILGPIEDADRGDELVLEQQLPAMRRNAQHLKKMIEQILDLQKLEGAAMVARVAPFDISQLTQEVTEAHQPLAARRGVALKAVPSDALVVDADREHVETILGNLLSNALKFTTRGDRVTVWVEHIHQEARLVVEDNGPGIPDDQLSMIFDRFHQADGGQHHGGGMGIGLALARELARLQQGEIEVASALGEGTRFTVSLSLHEAQAIEDSSPEIGRHSEPESGAPSVVEDERALDHDAVGQAAGTHPATSGEEADRPRILVIDDHEDVRRYVEQLLASRFAVSLAEDGERGLQAALEVLPDLIVADIMMPGMSGIELGEALAADPLTAGIPFLFLTARAGEDDVLEGLRAGAVAYVTKPFSSAELLARLDALIAQQHRLRDRLQKELRPMVPEIGPESGAAASVESSTAEQSSMQSSEAHSSDEGALEPRLRALIAAHMHDESFGVEELARAVAMSRATLFRKLKDESQMSPAALMRTVRLEKAQELLSAGEGTVSEVAYAVGFETLAGFSKAFKRHFGMPPSKVLDL